MLAASELPLGISPSLVEVGALVVGAGSAVLAGIAKASHKHALHESAEKWGGYVLAVVFWSAVAEGVAGATQSQDISKWRVVFGSDSTFHTLRPENEPINWGNIVGLTLLDLARDLLIAFIVYLIAARVIKRSNRARAIVEPH